jgi:hypothetical protein
MYRRIMVPYCGNIHLEKYSSVLVENGEVLVRTSYAYLSVADIALNNCVLVGGERKVLGSIAVGRVVDTGVDVDDIVSGSRVIVFTVNSSNYIDKIGGAQDMLSVRRDIVKIIKLDEYSDRDVLVLATLSIIKDLIDYIKGVDVVLIGEDISILTFAYYAKKYSCRVGVVPKHTIQFLSTVGTEHVSVYSSEKRFDVIILATHDPFLMCFAVKRFTKTKNSVVIMYPHMYRSLAFPCIEGVDITIKTMSFGDFDVGIEVFNAYKDSIQKMIKIMELDSIRTKVKEPLIVKL